MGVPDSGLEILYLSIPDTLNDSAYALVLRAHFAADAQHRASKDGTALFLKFGQMVMHIIKIPIEPFERRNGWRKKGVHVRLVLVPFRFERSGGELGFRLEEIIEASLFCAGPLADRVHRSGAVAVSPHQIQRRIRQALFHVTRSRHKSIMHLLTSQSTILFKTIFRWRAERSLVGSCTDTEAGFAGVQFHGRRKCD